MDSHDILFTVFHQRTVWLDLSLIFVLTLISFYAAYVFFRLMQRRVNQQKGLWYPALMRTVKAPLFAAIGLIGVFAAIDVLHDVFIDHEIMRLLESFRQILVALIVIWFLESFVRYAKERALSGYTKRPPDITTVYALTKLGHLIIWMVGILFVLDFTGVPLSGVMAFGGGSALVVGIAAKDLLANFFGGWVVIIDKPFKVGDWIRSPDHSMEGHVEYIGWRSTRIRTLDKIPLYVPNAVFTTIAIENPSRMSARRIKKHFGLRYADAYLIPQITADMTSYLQQHPDIDKTSQPSVSFVTFNDSELTIEISTYTKVTESNAFQALEQAILLQCVSVVKKHGADFAFPTRTLDVRPVTIHHEEKP